jgi:hypothetical protein
VRPPKYCEIRMFFSSEFCYEPVKFQAQCYVGNIDEHKDKLGFFWMCEYHAKRVLNCKENDKYPERHIFSLEEL